MIKCPNCTGEMQFKPTDQVVKCEYCGSTFKPSELKEEVKTSGEVKQVELSDEGKEQITGTAYTCSQCGATLMTFDETAITFCSYCGSQAMLESRMIKETAPDYIIPFKKEKEECINNYKKKLNKSLFAPNYMKNDTTVEKFRGIYMPYVVYKVGFNGKFENKGEVYSHRSGDYIYYDKYRITSDANVEYNGMSYDLISKYYDKFSEAIPFNFKEKEDFNPNYLIGFYADRGDVSYSIYERDAVKKAEEDASKRIKKYKEYSKYGCTDPNIKLLTQDTKVGMFPVYFLAIRDKSGTKVSYAIINGQTGEVAADIPVAFHKYIIASLILAIFIFLLINSYLVLTPTEISVIAMIFAAVSFVISAMQLTAIEKRRTHSDDIGYSFKNTNQTPEKKLNLFRYTYKGIIAFIIPMLVFLSQAADDKYYYFGAIISLIFVILSFYDLIKEHNILTSNKLPQLEKRGGDENG